MKLQEIIARLDTKEEPYSGEDLQKEFGHQNPVDLSIHGFTFRTIKKYSNCVYQLIYHNGVPICIAHYQSFLYFLVEYKWLNEEIYWNILKIIKNIHSQDIRLIDQNEEWDFIDNELKSVSEIILSEKQKLEFAKNPDTFSGMLEFLATDENEEVRGGVAENINTSSEILEQLATDRGYWIRWRVAKNPNTSPKVLERLATEDTDINDYVRWGVAKNPNTPPEILERIVTKATGASYIEVNIRRGVTLNPNTPPKALEKLANDEDYGVRWRVAYNPNTSTKTLEKLATDEYDTVREQAIENLKSRTLWREGHKAILAWLHSHRAKRSTYSTTNPNQYRSQ
jgi:hypothetical protein